MSNSRVVVAPYGDTLLRRRKLELCVLSAQRLILGKTGSGTRMAVYQHFKRVRFHPRVGLELLSIEAVKQAGAGGSDLGVISSHALHGRAREHAAAVWSVTGFRSLLSGTSLTLPRAACSRLQQPSRRSYCGRSKAPQSLSIAEGAKKPKH